MDFGQRKDRCVLQEQILNLRFVKKFKGKEMVLCYNVNISAEVTGGSKIGEHA